MMRIEYKIKLMSDFFQIGCEIMNLPKMAKNTGDTNQKFCAIFGATPEVCFIAWSLIESSNNLPKDGEKEHFCGL